MPVHQRMAERRTRRRTPGAGPVRPGRERPELARLRGQALFHEGLAALTLEFSKSASSLGTLRSALGAFAAGANRLIGARGTSIWLFDRRADQLTLAAVSDRAHGRLDDQIPATEPDAPAARGLRLDRPLLDRDHLIVPLRGWRRAIGSLVAARPLRPHLEDDRAIELALALGRQLAAAIETVQSIEEILRHRTLLESTLDSLIDLVLVTDSRLHIVRSNEAFAARLGVPPADLIARPLETLVDRPLAEWAAETVDTQGERTSVPEEAARTCTLADARLGGEFAVTMTPLVTRGQQTGQVIVARDITVQKRLESERETLRQQLARSERLASLGQFVAGVAHEMNNPLQGVLGHLELMIATSEAAKPLRRDLRRIYQEGERAARIVRNLLVFTGSHRIARRRLRPARVISRALASRAPSLRRAGTRIVRREAADLPWISGDALLLHQAFLNLLINAEHAVAAAGASGRIEIEVRLDAGRGVVVFAIGDNGPGIPEGVLPRVFDPFFTTREVGKGTGLGLAITYGIVQEHGGTIHAANAPEGGALMTIELPAVW